MKSNVQAQRTWDFSLFGKQFSTFVPHKHFHQTWPAPNMHYRAWRPPTKHHLLCTKCSCLNVCFDHFVFSSLEFEFVKITKHETCGGRVMGRGLLLFSEIRKSFVDSRCFTGCCQMGTPFFDFSLMSALPFFHLQWAQHCSLPSQMHRIPNALNSLTVCKGSNYKSSTANCH